MGRARVLWMVVLLGATFTVGCGQGVLSSSGSCRVPWQADEWAREPSAIAWGVGPSFRC